MLYLLYTKSFYVLEGMFQGSQCCFIIVPISTILLNEVLLLLPSLPYYWWGKLLIVLLQTSLGFYTFLLEDEF